VLYWQWRSALGGQEQYHGSLVDQSGQPRPFYVEAQTIGQEFSRLAPLLAQSKLAPASIAILNSYESRWSLQWQKHQADFDYVAHLHHYYRPLAQANFALDIVSTENNLDNYTLVFAPALTLITQQLAQRLRTFVEQGGHLVVTLRSGMKDEHNALLPMRQPGWLAELVGAEVEEYYALSQAVEMCGEGLRGTASLWAERLRLLSEKVVVMARYGGPNEWLKGFPAITAHPFGQGRVYFVAAYLESSLQTVVLQQIANSAGVTAEMETPSGIHVRKWLMRTGQEMYIAVNHTQQTQQVSLSWPMQEHLTQQRLTTELTIEPLGVALLTRL
jgi:beta-galactosidase